MVKELGTAYECKTCNGVFIGSREDAEKHEAILSEPALPKGLVFEMLSGGRNVKTYDIIADEGDQDRRSRVVTHDDYAHIPRQRKIRFLMLNQNLLQMQETPPYYWIENRRMNSILLKHLIDEGYARLLEPDELERFRKLYEAMDRRKMPIEIKPEELVFSLDDIASQTVLI